MKQLEDVSAEVKSVVKSLHFDLRVGLEMALQLASEDFSLMAAELVCRRLSLGKHSRGTENL